MIWLFLFSIMYLLCLKDYIVFSAMVDFSALCLFMGSICPIVLFMSLLFHFPFLSAKKKNIFSWNFTLLVLLISFTFLCSSAFNFLVLVEASVWPACFLFLNFSKDSDKLSSLMFMVFINIFGSIPFMIFCVMKGLKLEMTPFMEGDLGGVVSWLSFVCFTIVLASKIPVFFFHFWLSKAHVAASGAISMLLASLMIKLGAFGLYKFSLPFISLETSINFFFVSLSLWGSILVVSFMVRSSDLKYLVACSSILHMISILPLTLFYSSVSLTASILMSASHGVISLHLFFLLTVVYEHSLNRSWEFFTSLECMSKAAPMFFFIFLFLNMGVPPFANFFSELMICVFYLNYSIICVTGITVTMIVSVCFTIFFTCKIMFGKVSSFFGFNFPDSMFLFSFMVFLFLLLIKFLI